MWAILSAVEWAFVYIAAWRCIRDPLMAAPVLFCGIASMASLAVKLRPFKVHAHTRAIVPLALIGVFALIYAATRGRIHGLAVLTGMLLTYIVLRSCPQRKMLGVWMLCFGAMASSRCSSRRCWGIVRLSMSSWQRWSSAGLRPCSSRTSRSPARLRTRRPSWGTARTGPPKQPACASWPCLCLAPFLMFSRKSC